MPSIDVLMTLVATAALFAYVPGPAMLYTVAQTVARGRWSGLMACLGLHVGGYAHVVAAALGLSVLFHAVPVMFLIVKLAGAAYLVWLGIGLFRQKTASHTEVLAEVAGTAPKSGLRAFAESVTVELLNPKTAIFYLAFLPQFIDGSAALPVWAQFIILGTIVNMMFSSADLTVVALAGVLTKKLKESGRVQRAMQRVSGGVLVGLGVHLALQRS